MEVIVFVSLIEYPVVDLSLDIIDGHAVVINPGLGRSGMIILLLLDVIDFLVGFIIKMTPISSPISLLILSTLAEEITRGWHQQPMQEIRLIMCGTYCLPLC